MPDVTEKKQKKGRVNRSFSCTREQEARLEHAFERIRATQDRPFKYSFSRFLLDMVLTNPQVTGLKPSNNGSNIHQEVSAS